MLEWFAMGGVSMWAILAVDVVLAVVLSADGLLGAIALFFGRAVTPARILAVLVLLFCGLPAIVGVAGWLMGRSAVNSALAFVDPAQAEAIRVQGMAEARIPLQFGVTSTLVLGFLAFVVLAATMLASRRDEFEV